MTVWKWIVRDAKVSGRQPKVHAEGLFQGSMKGAKTRAKFDKRPGQIIEIRRQGRFY